MKEIVENFSPEDSAADLSILYETTGFQAESENFQFWENYKDFEELKLVREEVPEGALLLGEVVEEGAMVTREQVVARFAALVPPELHRVADRLELATFSFYNSSHRAAVSGLAHWLVELDFPAALSLLATLHGLAAPDLLLEVLTLTILGRRDCGLAMPDRAFIRPELYPVEWEEDKEEEGEVGNVHHHRQRRQLPQFVDWSDNGSGYFRENPR